MALYWPVTHFEFNNYDDAQYITENPVVQSGLTVKSVAWAFRSGYAGNWHPLTWLSHMLDCEIYGLNAGGHHFTNVLFHVANTLLLFSLLRRLTGAVWRAAFVAALFAWHPLHVESVAFVAERKDVLSTFFGLLTLLAYQSWVKSPRWPRYALALLLFALGLMSKPMVVTLPLLMLLLDFWPLGRLQPYQFKSWYLRLKEKLPFFVLTLVSCYVTFRVQKAGGAMSMTNLTLAHRVANALNSYVVYIAKIFWPRDLSVFYPYPHDLPLGRVIGAGVVLTLISAGALRFLHRRPHLAVGWFWFLISLVPVIGLVQVGEQAMADRYTYIPSIGIFIIVASEVPSWFAAWPPNQKLLTLVASVALVGCLVATSRQLHYWKNSITLWTHALSVTKDNALAHCDLGEALAASGKSQAALAEFNEALRINPDYPKALNNKGALLDQLGRVDLAIAQFKLLLKFQPHWYLAQRNFALALFKQGKLAEAIIHFQAALRSNPADGRSLADLGMALAREGKLDEAIVQYRAVLQIAPNAYAENALGSALEAQGKLAEAAFHYRAAVKIKPHFAAALNNLGAVLNVQGQFAEARQLFAAALAVKPHFAAAHCNFGNALLAEGKLNEAAAQYTETLRLQSNSFSAHYNLANILFKQNKWGAALSHYQAAVRLNPAFADVHVRLGMVLLRQGNDSGAMAQYRAALRLRPHALNGLKQLAWLLATSSDPRLRNGAEAIRLATQATRENPADSEAWDTLAAAQATVGQFDEAIRNAKKALELATTLHQNNLADQVRKRLQSYESGHFLQGSNLVECPQ